VAVQGAGARFRGAEGVESLSTEIRPIMQVFITSCETGKEAWNANEKLLKRLYELSDKRHGLADNPESADIVLVGNVREENWGNKI
jgi:hypothetical protein